MLNIKEFRTSKVQMHDYILLDAAKVGPQISTAKELNKQYVSLYREKSETYLAAVAPYLFTLNAETGFADWYYQEGWGQSWGTIISAPTNMEDLYRHFRRFLMVRTEDNRQLYFRFYDPRVLRIFLPTCDKRQVVDFFGPIEYFTVESEDGMKAMQYGHQNGIMQQKGMDIDRSLKNQIIH